jgi:hypothetical protein
MHFDWFTSANGTSVLLPFSSAIQTFTSANQAVYFRLEWYFKSAFSMLFLRVAVLFFAVNFPANTW